MKSNDIKTITRECARQTIRDAVKDKDPEKLTQGLEEMAQAIAGDYEQRLADAQTQLDAQILSARGVRQLTSDERNYYQAVLAAMRSDDPKQALNNIDKSFPTTTINDVFEDLRQNHPLLSKINFMQVTGNTRILVDGSEFQRAQWGELCDDIVKELAANLSVIESGLYKLSALMFVCKPGLELGPEWLDTYVRDVLYEALASGLEYGIVDGTGKTMPIGMTRQVGTGVTVTDGVYPRKSVVKVSDLRPATIGMLLSMLARGASGKMRLVRDVVLLVNPQDYYEKVMPATTLQAPDGTYRNDVMPYPMTIIPTEALETRGEAVLGSAPRYFAVAGIAKDGRIEYSDEYKFGEDKRTYIIKTYANGMPKDNNSFLLLDISELTPAVWKVEQVSPSTPSSDVTLSALSLGSAILSPAFDSQTDAYTATTSNASNTINATPADAGATIEVTLNGESAANGSALTWKAGSNAVEIKVTAQDGTSTGTYKVTVTKS
ncbi:MAG: phage major capsid protein [Oscillospiraceae bacterium]|nr:phage major capsid protein [Oscillospiraceae bacterium]